jgi:hypothetical protein
VLSKDNSDLRFLAANRQPFDIAENSLFPEIDLVLSNLLAKEIYFLDSFRKDTDLYELFYKTDWFNEIDKKASGYIDFDNFKDFFNRSNIHPLDEEVIFILRRIDIDDDGRIDKTEFVKFVNQIVSQPDATDRENDYPQSEHQAQVRSIGEKSLNRNSNQESPSNPNFMEKKSVTSKRANENLNMYSAKESEKFDSFNRNNERGRPNSRERAYLEKTNEQDLMRKRELDIEREQELERVRQHELGLVGVEKAHQRDEIDRELAQNQEREFSLERQKLRESQIAQEVQRHTEIQKWDSYYNKNQRSPSNGTYKKDLVGKSNQTRTEASHNGSQQGSRKDFRNYEKINTTSS